MIKKLKILFLIIMVLFLCYMFISFCCEDDYDILLMEEVSYEENVYNHNYKLDEEVRHIIKDILCRVEDTDINNEKIKYYFDRYYLSLNSIVWKLQYDYEIEECDIYTTTDDELEYNIFALVKLVTEDTCRYILFCFKTEEGRVLSINAEESL